MPLTRARRFPADAAWDPSAGSILFRLGLACLLARHLYWSRDGQAIPFCGGEEPVGSARLTCIALGFASMTGEQKAASMARRELEHRNGDAVLF